jgi:hypothetical protein
MRGAGWDHGPLRRGGTAARVAATLWRQLPPPNRQQLLWLLGRLLERQLRAAGPGPRAAEEADRDS